MWLPGVSLWHLCQMAKTLQQQLVNKWLHPAITINAGKMNV